MIYGKWTVFASVAIAYVLGAPSTSIADTPTVQSAVPADTVSWRLDQLESELAVLRADSPLQQAASNWDDGYKDGECCECSESSGFFAGFAFVWVKPHFKESFQATSYSLSANRMDLIGYDYDFGLSPRLWLGYDGSDGLGFRAGYFSYNQGGNDVQLAADADTFVGAQTITVSVPAIIQSTAPGQMLFASSGLEVTSLDLEGTIQLEIGETSVTAAAGVRYGRLLQDNYAAIHADGILQSELARRRKFEGFGPTLSADILRPVGSSGLAIYTGLRQAVLFGDKSIERSATGSVPASVGMRNVDDFTFTSDVIVGLQLSQSLGATEVSIRGGYEGSFWIDAGEPVLTLVGLEGFGLSLIVRR